MGHNDHIDYQLLDTLQELVEDASLDEDSEAYKIVLQVIEEQGDDGLTSEQKAIYERDVIPALKALGEQHEINRIVASNPD